LGKIRFSKAKAENGVRAVGLSLPSGSSVSAGSFWEGRNAQKL
jgi:hypothetical protein